MARRLASEDSQSIYINENAQETLVGIDDGHPNELPSYSVPYDGSTFELALTDEELAKKMQREEQVIFDRTRRPVLPEGFDPYHYNN